MPVRQGLREGSVGRSSCCSAVVAVVVAVAAAGVVGGAVEEQMNQNQKSVLQIEITYR
jgi:outer membrane lipoprotein SlyB